MVGASTEGRLISILYIFGLASDTLPAMSTRRLLLTLMTIGALLLASCSSDSDETVTIYSGRTEDLIGPILDDFETETGIGVEVKYDSSANLALLIQQEGKQSPADVFLSQSPGAVDFLDEAGLLEQLPDSLLSLVPSAVRDADGRWVGVSGRQRVLVYNQDLVDAGELPDSVLDLTDPAWEGRIGIAPANGSFQDFVTAMRGRLGDDATRAWLEGLVANGVQSYANNSAIVAAVGRGEIDAGLVNHYYNYRFLDEDPNHPGRNHQFATDDPGSVLIVTGAAIVDGTDQSEAATRLLEWLLAEEAQRYFADETFEYPLANGMEPSGDLPPATFADVGSIDLGSLSGGLEGTRDLITGAGLEG